MDDTSRGWGLLLGHQRGPHLAISGDFATAMDRAEGSRAAAPARAVESEEVKALRRENAELRRANDILKTASAFFAQAELDRRLK